MLAAFSLFFSHSVMLRLPTVGRALAGAAKGSLTPSNTSKTCVCLHTHLRLCVSRSTIY